MNHLAESKGRIRRCLKPFVFVLLGLSLALVGCGSNADGEPPATSTPASPTAVPPTPTPTPTIAELFPHQASWRFKNASGYKYTMTIALGEPMQISADGSLTHPRDRDFDVQSACSVDPKLDVVIPAYWSAEATTVGFDTPIAMRALFTNGGAGVKDGNYTGRGIDPYRGDNRLSIAQLFSDGPSCKGFSSTDNMGYGGTNGFGVEWVDPVRPGGVVTSNFFIVVRDYYSPATPNGDRALLDWIVLSPTFGGDNTDSAMVYQKDTSAINIVGLTLTGKIITGD